MQTSFHVTIITNQTTLPKQQQFDDSFHFRGGIELPLPIVNIGPENMGEITLTINREQICEAAKAYKF